jgi:hypothetical protein
MVMVQVMEAGHMNLYIQCGALNHGFEFRMPPSRIIGCFDSRGKFHARLRLKIADDSICWCQ